MLKTIEGILQRKPIILQLLKFVAIGAINTALDFAVLNFVSTKYGITAGGHLGLVNSIGFALAVVQSYFWNKYWAFGSAKTEKLFQNASRLILVGALGALVMGMVLVGSKMHAGSTFFLSAFSLLIVGELGIWFTQGIGNQATNAKAGTQFIAFLIVSLVGLLINDFFVGIISTWIQHQGFLASNADLIKNVAKIIATLASLVWNFIGYKLLVFRK